MDLFGDVFFMRPFGGISGLDIISESEEFSDKQYGFINDQKYHEPKSAQQGSAIEQVFAIEELPVVHEEERKHLNHELIVQELDDDERKTELLTQQKMKGNKGFFNVANRSYQNQSSSQAFPSQSSKVIYMGQNKSYYKSLIIRRMEHMELDKIVCGWKDSHGQMINASSKLTFHGALSITNDQDKLHQVVYVKPRKEKYDFR